MCELIIDLNVAYVAFEGAVDADLLFKQHAI